MAKNKNALLRYYTIDRCLRNTGRRWTLDDLVDACSDALYEYEGKPDLVSVRTVQLDLQMMRSDRLGYAAPIEVYDRKYYRYADPDFSIRNRPLSERDREVLNRTVDLLRRFDEFDRFHEMAEVVSRLQDRVASDRREPIVDFERNPNLRGLQFLNPLYDLTASRTVAQIEYKAFKATSPRTFFLSPQLLKEYNNRWFVFGAVGPDCRLFSLALDRIISITARPDLRFSPDPAFNLSYFDNLVGVTRGEYSTIEKVRIVADPLQAEYVRTKPIHTSQRELSADAFGNVTFELEVDINHELENLLLGFGPRIKVVQPGWLVEKLAENVKKMLGDYEKILSTQNLCVDAPELCITNQNRNKMKTIEGHDVKIFTDNIEQGALDQIRRLLSVEVFADKKIRIMPDVHAGAGCVIGFTGNLGDKVIPNIVGVDIGCGMRVLRLSNVDDIDFHEFHNHILTNIPSGQRVREVKYNYKVLVDEEMDVYRQAKAMIQQMRCYRNLKNMDRIHKAAGTLGGGNHFIELDRDEQGRLYLVIHTGSRNLGKQVAEFYQDKAIGHLTEGFDDLEANIARLIEEYKATGRRSEIQAAIKNMRKTYGQQNPSIPADLCYLEGQMREDYLHDMRLCQQWAVLNRRLIAMLLVKFFPGAVVEEEFESVHNYISDDNLIRKGAISAAEGEHCIIPLNMRDGSLICTGLGNPDWNQSAPHGAGRIMSRSQAYERVTLEEFQESMKGIYSESVNDFTRDESPMVYKPAQEIIDNISPTVTVTAVIKPIFNYKSSK